MSDPPRKNQNTATSRKQETDEAAENPIFFPGLMTATSAAAPTVPLAIAADAEFFKKPRRKYTRKSKVTGSFEAPALPAGAGGNVGMQGGVVGGGQVTLCAASATVPQLPVEVRNYPVIIGEECWRGGQVTASTASAISSATVRQIPAGISIYPILNSGGGWTTGQANSSSFVVASGASIGPPAAEESESVKKPRRSRKKQFPPDNTPPAGASNNLILNEGRGWGSGHVTSSSYAVASGASTGPHAPVAIESESAKKPRRSRKKQFPPDTTPPAGASNNPIMNGGGDWTTGQATSSSFVVASGASTGPPAAEESESVKKPRRSRKKQFPPENTPPAGASNNLILNEGGGCGSGQVTTSSTVLASDTSTGPPAPATTASESVTKPRRTRKKQFPPDIVPRAPSAVSKEFTGEVETNPGLVCLICLDMIQEPVITPCCGTTFCRGCVAASILHSSTGRCPTVGCPAQLTANMLVLNNALHQVMRSPRFRNTGSHLQMKADILETSQPPRFLGGASSISEVAQFLKQINLDTVSAASMSGIIEALEGRKQEMKNADEAENKWLTEVFLNELLIMKWDEMNQMKLEMESINRYLLIASSPELNNSPVAHTDVSLSGYERVTHSNSRDVSGFNTQPLRSVELHQSMSGQKMRLSQHFDALAKYFFDSKHAEILNGTKGYSDKSVDELENTVAGVTRYHSLKPLATLDLTGESNNRNVVAGDIVATIEFDKDNEFFAIGGGSSEKVKGIRVFEYLKVIGFDLECLAPDLEMTDKRDINCLSWNKFHKNQLASTEDSGNVRLWDVENGTELRKLPGHAKRASFVDWCDGDPRLLATTSNDYTVKLWSVVSGHCVSNVSIHDFGVSVRFLPGSVFEIACAAGNGVVYLHDLRKTKEPVGTLADPQPGYITRLNLMGNNEAVSMSLDNSVKLWKWETLSNSTRSTRSFTGHVNTKARLGLATDGKYIACGSETNSIYLYHKAIPNPIVSHKLHEYRPSVPPPTQSVQTVYVSSLAWKQGSPIIVAGTSNGTVKILEIV